MSSPPSREDLHRQVVVQMFSLVRCMEAPGYDTQVCAAAADDLARTVMALTESESSLMLQVRAGILFCNGVKLRLDVRVMAAAEKLGHAFHQANLAGLLFEHGVDQEVLCKVACMLARPSTDHPCDLPGVHTIQMWDELEGGAPGGRGRDTSLKTIFVMKRLMDALGTLSDIDTRVQREIVASLVDSLLASPGSMATLTALQDQPGGRFVAAVRRAVRGIWFARALGLPEDQLRRIGLAALFDGSAFEPTTLEEQETIVDDVVTLVVCWQELSEQSPRLPIVERLRADCRSALVSKDLLQAFETFMVSAIESCVPDLPPHGCRR